MINKNFIPIHIAHGGHSEYTCVIRKKIFVLNKNCLGRLSNRNYIPGQGSKIIRW